MKVFVIGATGYATLPGPSESQNSALGVGSAT
jgi:hypothetical protein